MNPTIGAKHVAELIDRTKALQFGRHEEASAIIRDAVVVARKFFGETSPYIDELNISFHPQEAIYNREHYRNKEAWNAGTRQLLKTCESMQLDFRLTIETTITKGELTPPEKVTIPWLVKHVPWALWVSAVGALLAAFIAGVALGRTTFIKELFSP